MKKVKCIAVIFAIMLSCCVCAACGKGEVPAVEPNEAVIAYEKVMDEQLSSAADGEDIHFTLGFLNADDTPELFICRGNGGIDAVTVCSYDPEAKVVYHLGDFSSRGSLVYYEKRSIIKSEYGNQGYFPQVYEKIEDGAGKIILVQVNYLFDDTEQYFSVAEPSGTLDEIIDSMSDNAVSAEEYSRQFDSIMGAYDNDICIKYDEMSRYTPDALESMMEVVCP